jgi:hypothetical protein
MNKYENALKDCALLGEFSIEEAAAYVARVLDEEGNSLEKGAITREFGKAYSRLWLCMEWCRASFTHDARRVNTKDHLKARKAACEQAGINYDPNLELGKLFRDMRESGISWGLISVLSNTPESAVRRMHDQTGVKAVGQRIGHGGRWVANRGDLYVDVHRKEGVVIPVGVQASSMQLEQALNYRAKEATKPPAKRAVKRTPAIKKELVKS